MPLPTTGQHDAAVQWLGGLRAEVASVSDPSRVPVEFLNLAFAEFGFDRLDVARSTLRDAVGRFGAMHVGSWTSVVERAARLCGRLGENGLLAPEVRRGVAWARDPEVVRYQTRLPEVVRELALQTGDADVAAELVSHDWPGTAVNAGVDRCTMARWRAEVAEVARGVPPALKAALDAAPGPDFLRVALGYRLMAAAVGAGLLALAADVAEVFGYLPVVARELASAAWGGSDRALYERVREGWLNRQFDAFRREGADHRRAAADARECAQCLRRLGDSDGYRDAVERFEQVVDVWTPERDWTACSVACDLAVLWSLAGDADRAAERLAYAVRVFGGEVRGLGSIRGSRSLMASTLSDAFRDVGDPDRAVRFARRVSARADRRALLVSALIAAGRDADASAELAKVSSGEARTGIIQFALGRMSDLDR
jgi:hypothetical protein